MACAAALLVVALVGGEDAPAPQRGASEPTRFGKRISREEARSITPANPYVPRTDEEGNVVLSGVGPGQISSQPDPLLSSEIMWPITNTWTARNHYEIVAVQAGRSASKPSIGLLAIMRSSTRDETGPTVGTLDVPGAGTLRITDAPLGRSVVGWAPKRAEIRFTGSTDVRGTLYLEHDSVELD